MPFAGFENFDACVAANQDKSDPEAYCGAIKHQVEGKMAKQTVKLSKAEVNYGSRKKDEQCQYCKHFNPVGKCQIVEGDIQPNLGCDLFAPITLTAKFTQNPDFPEPGIDIVTKKKKKTGFYSIINTKIGSMKSMLKKRSQSGSKKFYREATHKINNMKKMVSRK